MPLQAVPWLVDPPPQSKIARQLGQLGFVQILEVGDAVGSEAILLLKLAVALCAHQFAVLANSIQRAIENNDAARWFQAAAGFSQCAVVIGGIVQRGVED